MNKVAIGSPFSRTRFAGGVRRKGVLGGVFVGACLCVLSAFVSGSVVASAASAPSTSKSVKPDFAYFAGKTITLIPEGDAGSNTDLLDRALAPLVASYLHASAVVVDEPGSLIEIEDAMAGSPPNGLYIGELDVAGIVEDLATNTPGLTFSMSNVPLLGGLGSVESLFVSNPTTGPKTIQQLIKSTTPINFLQSQSGGFLLEVEMLKAAYKADDIDLVLGYTSSQLPAALLRGDGPATGTALGLLAPLVEAGEARPLLMTRQVSPGMPAYAHLNKLPTLASLYAKDPPKTKTGKAIMKALVNFETGPGYVFFTPKGTPEPYVLALQAAIRSAVNQPGMRAEILTEGFSAGFTVPATSKTEILHEIKEAPRLTQFLNS